MGEQTIPADAVYGAGERVHPFSIPALAAGADLADVPVFTARQKCRVRAAKVNNKGASIGIDGSNTCVIALKKKSTAGVNLGTIFTTTLEDNTAALTATDLGNPDTTYWTLDEGQTVT